MTQPAITNVDNLLYFVRRMNELGFVTLTVKGERLLTETPAPKKYEPEDEYACYS